MLKRDRQNKIMEMLHTTGSVLVSEIVEKLDCSDQTVRRDLQEMEEAGMLKRIHGGAYLPDSDDRGVPISLRELLIPEEKMHIAKTAMIKFASDGDRIMFDSSTTCYTMAREIMEKRHNMTIITNSAKIVSLFTDGSSTNKLIAIGGRYKERIGAFIGDDTIRGFSNYMADKAFISCNAMTQKYGILDNYEPQKTIRQTIISHARNTYLLVDHTKFDDTADMIIGPFSLLTAVITDQKPSAEWLEFFHNNNIEIYW